MSPPRKRKGKPPGAPREGFILPARGRRVYLGTAPGPSESDLDPETAGIIEEYLPRLKGNREQIRMKVSMIVLTSHVPGKKRMSATQAYLSMNPGVKPTSAASIACRLMREIEKEVGDEGRLALQGIHLRRIARILNDASGAQFVRQFIDTKTGKVIEGRPLVDHAVRLRAGEDYMKLLGLGKEKEPGVGPITLNVISYVGNPASALPWPGGGRFIDGKVQDVVGPNSPAARAALPAARQED